MNYERLEKFEKHRQELLAHHAGDGVILDIKGQGGDSEVIIHFVESGQKTLLLSWAPIEKL